MGLQICGVDMVRSARGPLILEVNVSPGFGIEKSLDATLQARSLNMSKKMLNKGREKKIE